MKIKAMKLIRLDDIDDPDDQLTIYHKVMICDLLLRHRDEPHNKESLFGVSIILVPPQPTHQTHKLQLCSEIV